MSLLTFNPLPRRFPPAAPPNRSFSKLPKVVMMKKQALPPLQMEEKKKPSLQEETFNVTSRREVMCLTAASLGVLSLPLPSSAEAHVDNTNPLQKIIEKFEELGQKIGLLKPKDEGVEKKAKPENGGTDKKPTSSSHHSGNKASVPTPPSIINGKTTNATST